VNPQVRDFALGHQEEITWTSTDGQEVGGILILPVGYQEGQRYPTVVQIHGGPSSAIVNNFSAAVQVYAGAGYAVLRPNYRGSSGYGEDFENINGVYFPQGYDDIMAGMDHLIAEGITDGDRMGAYGWSAGGHWSNWILVNTDRFKAISSGAGASNWISMYAQSDGQRHRQEYFGGRAAVPRLRRVLGPVAAQVHRERQDAHDDPCGEGRPSRAEPAVGGAAHGAAAAGRADRALHVPGRIPRHSRRAQPAGQGRVGNGVDGLLRARAARGEKAAVVAVVQAFLDALAAKDPEALAATMMPDGAIHSVNMGAGRESEPIRGRTTADDVASIATTRAALLERIWEPDVRVHGRVAVVWTPYDFWTDGRFSHCGIDAFTLLKAPDGWKISSIAYTVEPEGCLPSPLGPPTPEQLGVP
jgi:ketosteroid isomerase-like protein